MDYRELLKNYMNHVSECEGVTFVGSNQGFWSHFTPAEQTELRTIEAELTAEWIEGN
jgi:hypothetical protein